MSWNPSPNASSSSDRPTKRIKVEDERDDPVPVPANAEPQALPTPPASAGYEVVQLVQEQITAVNIIVSGENVFLTGAAGSGKTMALKQAIARLRELDKRVRIAALTGKAAQVVGGTTLHSLFGLTPKKMEKKMNQLEDMVITNSILRQRLLDTDVLVIDEISMVENIFFERLSRMMQAAKKNNEPFGGVQLIACGDFQQLAPVLPFSFCFTCGKSMREQNDRDRRVKTFQCLKFHQEMDETDQWAFRAQTWTDAEFTNVFLKHNHRQNEERFVAALNRLAKGRPLLQAERDLLYNHACDVSGAIYLFATNKEVDEKNNDKFAQLRGRQVDYHCLDDFKWRTQHRAYADFGQLSQDGWTLQKLGQHPYATVLRLKQGMPVILTTNLDVDNGLVNGSQGRIVRFERYNEATLPRSRAGIDRTTIYIDLDEEEEPLETVNVRGGQNLTYRQEQVKRFLTTTNFGVELPVVQFLNGKTITVFPDCGITELGDEEPYSLLSRTQIPLVAGWAMNVHKSQGMTMDKVIVDVSKMFCPGQVYVALSRAKKLYGLKVVGLDKGLDGAGANPEVTQFMENTVWHRADLGI